MTPEKAIEKLSSLNLKEVSRNTGIPYDRMAKWKQGKGLPKPKDLQQLIDYFNGTTSIKKDADAEKVPGHFEELLRLKDQVIENYKTIVDDKNAIIDMQIAEIQRLKRELAERTQDMDGVSHKKPVPRVKGA
ncbi:hypothetical protein [Arachidicoccus terrestris]|uniref:hypothetical protein n=1 Tax=Arachidicoccus terrestris TaxID=2875539 RepID=UPI001CC38648|nr:hypothetical protein [Arachidicoccus terrestris]UAY56227.1 hypothetical protein K9M52_04205 [Arachidicoccus terrestris]